MPWVVGVDVGGTFTDFYAYNSETLSYRVYKLASTPAEPDRAILDGFRALCGEIGIGVEAVQRLEHGTTVATNALIQQKGARVALVTTRNFRDLLEIQRQVRPHMYSFQKDFPTPLVPRELRLEVGERVTASGAVLTPLDEGDIDAAITRIRDSGVEAVAVCFLFSFLRPDHERRVRDRLAAALPGSVRLHLLRSAAGVSRVRAALDDGAERLPAAGGHPLPRPAGAAAGARRPARLGGHQLLPRRPDVGRARAAVPDPHRAVGAGRRGDGGGARGAAGGATPT